MDSETEEQFRRRDAQLDRIVNVLSTATNSMERYLERSNARMDRLEQNMGRLEQNLERLERDLSSMGQSMIQMERNLDALIRAITSGRTNGRKD